MGQRVSPAERTRAAGKKVREQQTEQCKQRRGGGRDPWDRLRPLKEEMVTMVVMVVVVVEVGSARLCSGQLRGESEVK